MSPFFRANNWKTWVDNNYSPIFSEKMLKIPGNWKTGRETGDVIHICFFFEKSAIFKNWGRNTYLPVFREKR